MKNDWYSAQFEAADRRRAQREFERQAKEEEYWRDRLLSADEKAEYERLRAAVLNPPRSLGHRAALPTYLLMIPWVGASLGLVLLTMNREVTASSSTGITLVILFLVVVFGGAVGLYALFLRRSRIAMNAYERGCAVAMRDYLIEIGYPARLRNAKADLVADEPDTRRYYPRHYGRSYRDYRNRR